MNKNRYGVQKARQNENLYGCITICYNKLYLNNSDNRIANFSYPVIDLCYIRALHLNQANKLIN